MNNTTNENAKPLSVQEQDGNTDMQQAAPQNGETAVPLNQFFEEAEKNGKSAVTEEDPFFSPLPDISLDDGDAADETETAYISERELSAQDADAAAASDDGAQAPVSDGDKPRSKLGRTVGIVGGAVGGTVLLIFAVLCIILFRLSGPITVDLDETVSLGALETDPFLSSLTEAVPRPSEIDTSTLGEQQISLTFFGFLPRTVTVSVCDLTMPAVTAYRMTVGVGSIPDPDDCVLRCEDKTAVVHTFAQSPDTSAAGDCIWTLLSTDAGGNTVQTEVTATVVADACTQNIEFGTDKEAISAMLSEAYPEYPILDLTETDDTVCGTYRVMARNETERAVLSLVLSDTTAPNGRAHNFNLLSGTVLTPEDFVTDIKDASAVTLSYKTAPDYECLVPQTVTVVAADAHGNETAFSCVLQIWDIANELTAECGTTLDALKKALFARMTAAGAALPTFDRSFDPATLAPGVYDIRLHGAYSTPTVSLTMVDTTPPKLTVKPVTVYLGHTLTPDAVIAGIDDATDVKLSFENTPDITAVGTFNVTVIAEDAGGNKAEAQTSVSVIADTAAPQIYGVKTIYAQQNGTVSYRSGVSAYDNADGNVAVKVDASRVDVSKVGKYTVVYTATDKAGNIATQSATVYVTGANQASVNLYADEILAVILRPGMTDTQKALAIYNWCVGHLRYSTSTSHLMGRFVEAAYSGFTKHIGNCYTYYAVASALLSRAGIENIEIQRNNPNAPHYWNLVKIGGNWYHLDTCPKWKSYPIKTFLLTDRQVKHYSQTQNIGYYSFDASRYPATP